VGSTDVPLDAGGKRQANALAALLGKSRAERCFSSPLRRAMETAEAAAAPLGLTVETDLDLREIDFGLWEGRTFEEIQQSDPQAVSDWATNPTEFAFPGGEAVRDFVARVSRAADRMAADPAEVVLAVTHGGVVRAAICHLLGLPVHNYVLFDVGPASLTAIELFDGKGVLTGLDNSCSVPPEGSIPSGG
jgi:broad specificity phosphatase PhoE